jgi:hypothetical protein
VLSVAPQPGKVKRARLCDGYRARTFGVCKGRRKAGLCLCVDLAADADVEHCRPWCVWIEALAELNLVRGNLGMPKAELSPGPLSNSFTATSRRERSCLAAQTKRQWRKQRPSDPPRQPSASTVRAPPTMPAPPTLRVRSLSELPFY